MNISQLLEQSRAFRQRLLALKVSNPPSGFTWYGYEIFGNFTHLERMLTGENREIFARVKDRPILDVGAADGDLAFFLESLGYRVDIVDWPSTNWNGLRGARRIKELLGSGVGIHEIDIDAVFEPPSRYGLVVFLGILYHLRNPMLALERFARCSDYLLLSTRVARFAPDGRTALDGVSVAYLLGPEECNNDATNWWIFSRPGLRKLVARAGWQILDELSVGATERSDPARPDRDERVFMLLRSAHA
jgi:hypothetical protein